MYVENLSEVEVKSMQDVVYLLLKGAANRRVAATHMNAESSRSHSVFACTTISLFVTNNFTRVWEIFLLRFVSVAACATFPIQ